MINKQFQLLASEETDENIGSSPPEQPDINVMDKYRFAILYVLLASVILTSALNVFTPKSNEIHQQLYDDDLQPISQEQEQELVKKLETEYKNHSYKISFGNKSLERITYGQPRPKNSFLRVVTFRKKGSSSGRQCLFTNGVNIISNKTSATGKIFMSQKQINKWIIVLPNIDLVADDIINQFMNETNSIYEKQSQQLKIDSHYKFIRTHTTDCQSIIYVQNNFLIDEENKNHMLDANIKAKQSLKGSYCIYSKNARNLEDKSVKLQSLKSIDLSQFKEQKFNQYVYIFTTDFFTLITPLNYANFNKYTIDQIIVFPILALTQKSHKLIQLQKAYHKFDQAVVQFKQFQLLQPPRITPQKSFCFISYPIDPRVISMEHFRDYINSLANLNIQEEKIIIIIYVPYNFKQNKQELNEIYNELIEIQKQKRFYTIKIRIQQARAVSSIAAYQSAHTYCPQQSYVISSRLNIVFDKELINKLNVSLTEKVHYYSVNPRLLSQKVKGLLSNYQSNRFDIQKYLTQFSEVQIFKVQLMKMINLWTLKSDQSKFFQSQASFVLPLLQMCDHFVKKISESELYLIKVPRKISIQQNLQMKLLQKYSIWDKIKDNILMPIKHNSLTNLDLRRGALDNIPKIIHQIWFREEAIPQKIHKLQDTIKEVNKDYKYILWKKENLTTYDFPMSYNHIAKVYQYQWVNKRSYHPWIQALMSYEILYNHGGIYLSLKAEAIKPLDPFLKYQLFFAGYYNNVGNYGSPISIGRQIMGSKIHGYHMRFIIAELITEQRINLQLTDYQALVGGDIVRLSLSDSELYTTTAFGFHLFNYDPMRKGAGLCDNEPIPCQQYTESYIVLRNLN